jgi:hypothetical protein
MLDRIHVLIAEDLPGASHTFESIVSSALLRTQFATLPQDIRIVRDRRSLESSNILDFVRRGSIILLDAHLGTDSFDGLKFARTIFAEQQAGLPAVLLGISLETGVQPYWTTEDSPPKRIFKTYPNKFIGKGSEEIFIKMNLLTNLNSRFTDTSLARELDTEYLTQTPKIDIQEVIINSINYIDEKIKMRDS